MATDLVADVATDLVADVADGVSVSSAILLSKDNHNPPPQKLSLPQTIHPLHPLPNPLPHPLHPLPNPLPHPLHPLPNPLPHRLL